MLAEDFAKLKKLKSDLAVCNARIILAKRNLGDAKQMLSPSLLSLYKEKARLEAQIAELGEPPDFTPSPAGCAPVPPAALYCA